MLARAWSQIMVLKSQINYKWCLCTKFLAASNPVTLCKVVHSILSGTFRNMLLQVSVCSLQIKERVTERTIMVNSIQMSKKSGRNLETITKMHQPAHQLPSPAVLWDVLLKRYWSVLLMGAGRRTFVSDKSDMLTSIEIFSQKGSHNPNMPRKFDDSTSGSFMTAIYVASRTVAILYVWKARLSWYERLMLVGFTNNQGGLCHLYSVLLFSAWRGNSEQSPNEYAPAKYMFPMKRWEYLALSRPFSAELSACLKKMKIFYSSSHVTLRKSSGEETNGYEGSATTFKRRAEVTVATFSLTPFPDRWTLALVTGLWEPFFVILLNLLIWKIGFSLISVPAI